VYPFELAAERSPPDHQRKATAMSPQRARMIDDMILAGLADGAPKLYLQAVRRLAAHCRRSPAVATAMPRG
jgi:hypothetical protein